MLLIEDVKALVIPPKCFEYYKTKLAQDKFYISMNDRLNLDQKLDEYKDAAQRRYIEALDISHKWNRRHKLAYRRLMIRAFAIWTAGGLALLGSMAFVELFY